MKKVVSAFLCFVLFLSFAVIPANAIKEDNGVQCTTSIEYLSDGSYYIVEVVQAPSNSRSYSTSGSKTATYYNSAGTAIWKVTVNGTFTYTTGVSAKATSASATVGIANSNAQFIEKNAYTSGASAYGYGKVKYKDTTASKTVVLTCDKYGNLS